MCIWFVTLVLWTWIWMNIIEIVYLLLLMYFMTYLIWMFLSEIKLSYLILSYTVMYRSKHSKTSQCPTAATVMYRHRHARTKTFQSYDKKDKNTYTNSCEVFTQLKENKSTTQRYFWWSKYDFWPKIFPLNFHFKTFKMASLIPQSIGLRYITVWKVDLP